MCPFLGDTNYSSPIWPRTQPPMASRARQWRGILWAAATKIGAFDTCKGYLLVLLFSGTQQTEHQEGTCKSPSPEYSSRFLNACVKWNSCPLSRCFNISRWTSFTVSLRTVSCLWAGPGVGKFKGMSPFLKIVGLHMRTCWFSKLDVCGTYLSSSCLKSWGTWWVCTPCSSRKSSRFWLSSQLWIATSNVGFMATLCSSLSYPLCCGFPLLCLIRGCHSSSL